MRVCSGARRKGWLGGSSATGARRSRCGTILAAQNLVSMAEHDEELHPHGGDWLREIVFGLNDGLVTTLVFILAVGAVASTHLVAIALGEVAAGGVSMALGGYLSSRTTRDILEH